MSTNPETEWLRKRLDAIIQLLMESSPSAAKTVSSKIERLLDLGFSNTETGLVVGKPANYVGAIASQKKKNAAKGGVKTKSPSSKKAAKARKGSPTTVGVNDAQAADDQSDEFK